MTTETSFVSIPLDEYRTLLKTHSQAECLKAFLVDKLKRYDCITFDVLEMLCTMFVGNNAKIEEKEEDF